MRVNIFVAKERLCTRKKYDTYTWLHVVEPALPCDSLLPLKRPCSLSRTETAFPNPKFGEYIIYICHRLKRILPVLSYKVDLKACLPTLLLSK